jgi:hypothetical protein
MPLGSFVSYGRTAGHMDPIITHEETFLASRDWVVPADVHEISAVCVGGGGGGAGDEVGGGGGAGGDLRWGIKIPVTPGETLTVTVGAGGRGTDDDDIDEGENGGITGIYRSATPLLVAAGGAGGEARIIFGSLPAQKPQNGTSTPINLPLVGGGLGGRGGWEQGQQQAGGGGGAAGYSGPGGSGGHADELNTFRATVSSSASGVDPGYDGSGGGGSGGTAAARDYLAGGGGGVGLLGEGPSGRSYFTRNGVAYPTRRNGTVGEDGSPRAGGTQVSVNGRLYGGGGGGHDSDEGGTLAGNGAQGAARIIWGRNRYYPRANTPKINKFPSNTPVSSNVVNFTTPGTYSFVVPEGTFSLNALTIGAGGGANSADRGVLFACAGGGGGALGYGNNIPVTPGETLTVTVGAGGQGIVSPTANSIIFAGNGGASKLSRGGTDLIVAGGGGGGQSGGRDTVFTHAGGAGGVASGTSLSQGFTGGKGGDAVSPGGGTEAFRIGGAGGGGAAGYLGNGGAGANAQTLNGAAGSSAAPNSGGGGGGGSGAISRNAGGGGGGVGLTYTASSNPNRLLRTAVTGGGGSADTGGFGGSGGSRGEYNQAIGGSHVGGAFGGGAGAGGDDSNSRRYITNGAAGAVQITYGGIDPYPGTAV